MFRLKVADAKLLRDMVTAISTLIDEATFNITTEGIKLRAMDPSRVAMVDFAWPKTVFDEYACSEAMKMCAHCGYPSIDRAAERCAECGGADFVETLRPSRKSCLIGALGFIGILTAVEAAVIWGAKYMGWSGHIPYLFSHPIYGIINLAAFNGGLTVVIWLMHVRTLRKDRRDLPFD